jgi:hypothetical protein
MEYLIEHAMKTKRRQNDKKIKYKLGKFVDFFCNIYILFNVYLDMQLKKGRCSAVSKGASPRQCFSICHTRLCKINK